MSKMRVHELAKELEKTSKDIIEVLEKTGVEVKGHMAVLSEEEIAKVKAAFAPKKKRPPEKKKKNIIQVFNPQNSRMSGGPDERLKRERKPARSGEERRRPVARDEEGRPIRPVREGERRRPRPEGRSGEEKQIKAQSVEQAFAKALGTVYKEETPKTQEEKSPEAVVETKKVPESVPVVEAVKPVEDKAPVAKQPVEEKKPVKEPEEAKLVKEERAAREERTQKREGERRESNQKNDRGPRNDRGRDGDRAQRGGYNNQRGGYNNQRSEGGRNEGNRHDNSRGEGFRGDSSRHDNSRGENRRGFGGQGNRGGRQGRERLQMPDRPVEAIERQTQKNERQNQRNDKRDNRREERDSFDKKQNKAAQRNLQKPTRKPVKPQPQEPKEETIKTIVLPESLTIKELADKMKVQPSVIVKKLFMQGTIVTVNQEIDFDTAEEIALEYNCIAEPEVKVDVIAELLKEEEESQEAMEARVPVVCVMGHVDHGKTSLLDAIRNTRVTDREAGGITQHIGASVVTCNGEKITFLDTPGHEAFTAMRMRGANSTDIAILVVAADDGVMPQTVEAISHAKAAGVEIIVAINKIDKPSANIEKVKQELSEYELIPEDWGGSTIFVPVSAHTQEGIDTLLEMVLLTAEVLELKANPKRRARGLVIEGKLDKGKGPVATVLVQKGTLHVGDFIAAGACSGKVRAMMDDQGRRVKEAGPSMPVEILGFNDVPGAGEVFVSPESDKEAKHFAETFVSQGREKMLEETKQKMSLDDLFSQIQAGNLKELNLIVKADVQGSVEAVKASLVKLSNEEVVVKVIHGGVGAVNESDVSLAAASNAIIIGFNVRPDATAKMTAEREGVDLRLYKVIYNAIEDVEAAMKGMLDPVFEEKILGHAEVRQLFKASGVGTIAGSYVLDGVFQRGCNVRIKREEEVIFDGQLASLKRFKDDVKEVRAGYECGLVVEKFNDISEGDIYEAYAMVEVPR